MNTDFHSPLPGILPYVSRFVATAVLCTLWACGGDGGSPGLEDTRQAQNSSNPQAKPTKEVTEGLPNVVLVVIDSFRPDHMNANGYRRLTTSYLDGLIPQAVYFQNAYSTSSASAPATASLLTSLYPPGHGVNEGVAEYTERARILYELTGEELTLGTLVDTAVTLPEVFQQNGYQTYAFSSNPQLGEGQGLFRGFDHFQHMPQRDAQVVTRKILSMKERILKASPSLLYVQFSDPQKPYHFRHPWFRNSPDPRKQAIGAYNSELSYVDRELLRLHEEFGWDRNTLLVIVSTHGEALWDHGLVGHGLSLYDAEMRALFLIFGPDLDISPRAVQTHVSLVDVAPTILDLLHMNLEPSDGLSLVHLLAERPPRGVVQRFRGRPLFGHLQEHRATTGEGRHHLMATLGPWKLLSGPEGETLFHLFDDPEEANNLLGADEPQEADDLRRALASFRERNRLAEQGPAPPRSTAEKLQELLRRDAEGDGP